jgi:crossover junction endodeoxyribonuclease RusA
MPLLELMVLGPPVSYQTKDKNNLKAWQALIKAEAGKVWTSPPLTGKLKFMLINFHEGAVPPLDDDNMVKPIRDALNGLVYQDNRQIRYSETIQVSIDDPIRVRRASKVLLDAFAKGDEFLYVRIEGAPDFIQLPQ